MKLVFLYSQSQFRLSPRCKGCSALEPKALDFDTCTVTCVGLGFSSPILCLMLIVFCLSFPFQYQYCFLLYINILQVLE
jgi:hypothetical protein